MTQHQPAPDDLTADAATDDGPTTTLTAVDADWIAARDHVTEVSVPHDCLTTQRIQTAAAAVRAQYATILDNCWFIARDLRDRLTTTDLPPCEVPEAFVEAVHCVIYAPQTERHIDHYVLAIDTRLVSDLATDAETDDGDTDTADADADADAAPDPSYLLVDAARDQFNTTHYTADETTLCFGDRDDIASVGLYPPGDRARYTEYHELFIAPETHFAPSLPI